MSSSLQVPTHASLIARCAAHAFCTAAVRVAPVSQHWHQYQHLFMSACWCVVLVFVLAFVLVRLLVFMFGLVLGQVFVVNPNFNQQQVSHFGSRGDTSSQVTTYQHTFANDLNFKHGHPSAACLESIASMGCLKCRGSKAGCAQCRPQRFTLRRRCARLIF